MADATGSGTVAAGGTFAPLRERVFRRIWSASLLSNFGQLILGVGAAWEMTRLTTSASMVALVQTALMVPLMLVAVPAGAIADMFDRRKVAMLGLGVSAFFATILATLAFVGLTTPWLLLAFCSLVGVGNALYSPAWQASIGEQVEPAQIPAAVALNSISYNVARSFGPAIGGVIVLAAGAQAAFLINAICYLPLLFMYLIWRRKHVPSRLPPERIERAIVSGARYALHSSSIRTVLARAFCFGLSGAATVALAPLIARDMLDGDAGVFGILLGSSGVGAVVGAFMLGWFRERFGTERSTPMLAVVGGLSVILVGLSHSLSLTCLGLFIAGGTSIATISMFNVAVQIAAPRWVTARALSLFASALTGGIAIGSGIWGGIAGHWSVEAAVITSGIALLSTALLARILPLPETIHSDVFLVELADEPEVAMALTMRSGPIVIDLHYDVDPANAREFYDAMLKVQRTRLRNGGFNWSLSRDIANPAHWNERFQCPTWGDYLRMRDRFTQADMEQQAAARSFHRGEGELRVTRMLERPFGSVRWKSDSPDTRQGTIGYIGP